MSTICKQYFLTICKCSVFFSILLIATDNLSCASESPDFQSGRETYVAICSSCHGIDGKASLSYAPSFYYGERLEKDILILVRSVRNGLGRMPPHEAYLKDSQIADAISYARTLKNK